jgi:hypothetical protein
MGVTTTQVEDREEERKTVHMKGGKKDILISFAVLTLPMLLLSTLLLRLIFANRIRHGSPVSTSLSSDDTTDEV